MTTSGRIGALLLADTHLGFDLPLRFRVERRRRGEDFFENARRALEPALRREVDLVVHAGDLFFRSRVPTAIVGRGFDLLLEVADAGVPVVLVPGNHERSTIPRSLLLSHPRVHVFDRPRTFVIDVGGVAVSLAGFPYARDVRRDFPRLVDETGSRSAEADVRLLCIHQAVEGATVGPASFTFRGSDDVVRGRDLPSGFAAILAGHIHRFQVIERDLAGVTLPAPVVYPGSVERTSFAERFEEKGYVVLEMAAGSRKGGELVAARFQPLPTRPMVDVELDADDLEDGDIETVVRQLLAGVDPDAVVRFRVLGEPSGALLRSLSASRLRSLAPPTVTVELALSPSRGGGAVGRGSAYDSRS